MIAMASFRQFASVLSLAVMPSAVRVVLRHRQAAGTRGRHATRDHQDDSSRKGFRVHHAGRLPSKWSDVFFHQSALLSGFIADLHEGRQVSMT